MITPESNILAMTLMSENTWSRLITANIYRAGLASLNAKVLNVLLQKHALLTKILNKT